MLFELLGYSSDVAEISVPSGTRHSVTDELVPHVSSRRNALISTPEEQSETLIDLLRRTNFLPDPQWSSMETSHEFLSSSVPSYHIAIVSLPSLLSSPELIKITIKSSLHNVVGSMQSFVAFTLYIILH